MSSTPLGPGAEFDVIREVLKDAVAPGAMVALGAGDDCALLRSGDAYLAVLVSQSCGEWLYDRLLVLWILHVPTNLA